MIQPAEIQVRFADLDILGHVNNGVYLAYFEMARVHYFKELLGTDWDWNQFGVVLVKNEVEYIQPILLHDAPEIHMTCEKIGEKSFELSYRVMVDGHLYTKGKSILVCFDARARKSINIPEKMKNALKELKGNDI